MTSEGTRTIEWWSLSQVVACGKKGDAFAHQIRLASSNSSLSLDGSEEVGLVGRAAVAASSYLLRPWRRHRARGRRGAEAARMLQQLRSGRVSLDDCFAVAAVCSNALDLFCWSDLILGSWRQNLFSFR